MKKVTGIDRLVNYMVIILVILGLLAPWIGMAPYQILLLSFPAGYALGTALFSNWYGHICWTCDKKDK